MTRRILAIVIAFVASIAGHLLVFTGGIELFLRAAQFGEPHQNPLLVLAIVAGLLLIAVAALTVAVSSAGVIVLGALHILFGLLTVLLPLSLEFRPPAYQLTVLLRDLNPAWGDGMLMAFTLGTGFLTGVILLVGGLAARGRTMHGNLLAIIVSIAVGLVGLVGVLTAVVGGSLIYRSMLQRLSGEIDVIGVALLLGGSVLVAAAVITVRWSSAGVVVLGAVVILIGVVSSLLPPTALWSISRDLGEALSRVAPSGLLALVGVVLVAVGVGASVRARRAARAVEPAYAPAPAVTPAEGPDPQVV